jgi:hypothetical protein
MKSRAEGFRKKEVTELFNLIESIFNRTLNGARLYVYNIYETALTTF